MKIILIALLLWTLPALACWRAQGSLAVDGETWKFDQKIEHNKEYLFPMGTFTLKFTVKKKKGTNTFVYVVQEKKGLTLTNVTMGDEEVETGKDREIYAKGLEGQPNSIITIKLLNI